MARLRLACAHRSGRERRAAADQPGATGDRGLEPRVLIIDNYDLHLQPRPVPGELGAEVEVIRNDVDDLLEREPGRVIVSPGPRTPNEAGLSMPAVRHYGDRGTPVLGVCLGHQSLAQEFGARVVRGEPVHGKTAVMEHDGRTIYAGLESPLVVGRYHSLVVDPATLPDAAGPAHAGEVIMGATALKLRSRVCSSTPSRCSPPRKQCPQLPLGRVNNPVLPTRSTGWRRRGLAADEASRVLREVMEESLEAETAGLLVALRTKGETVHEIGGRPRRCGRWHCAWMRRRSRRHRGTGGGRPTSTCPHGGLRGRGSGVSGGQARKPLCHQPVRVPLT